MNCPSCQSETTQTIKMVLLSGSSTSKGKAVGVDIRGDVAVADMSSKSRTNLAASLDPGAKPSDSDTGCGLGCGGAVAVLGFAAMIGGAGAGVVFLILGLLVIGWALMTSDSRKAALAKKIAQWEEKRSFMEGGWICHRCGYSWIPE